MLWLLWLLIFSSGAMHEPSSSSDDVAVASGLCAMAARRANAVGGGVMGGVICTRSAELQAFDCGFSRNEMSDLLFIVVEVDQSALDGGNSVVVTETKALRAASTGMTLAAGRKRSLQR
ncbi:hypothetical protein KRP22_006374 [Phytophthora ramorum]|nr:hypothetical protein KRP22_2493 [Phytophthora ramorum]KAH7507396.1 hypothetical protein KRP22_2498 [Phytophthora ramorum]